MSWRLGGRIVGRGVLNPNARVVSSSRRECTSPFCWKLGGHFGVRRTGYAGRTCAKGSSACTWGGARCGALGENGRVVYGTT